MGNDTTVIEIKKQKKEDRGSQFSASTKKGNNDRVEDTRKAFSLESSKSAASNVPIMELATGARYMDTDKERKVEKDEGTIEAHELAQLTPEELEKLTEKAKDEKKIYKGQKNYVQHLAKSNKFGPVKAP